MAETYGSIFSILMNIHSCSGHTYIPTISLFIIAKSQNQPRCCSTDEWVKKMCYIFTIFSYKDKIMSFLGKWVILEITMQREIRQSQKDKYCVFSHIQNLDLNIYCSKYDRKIQVKHWGRREVSVWRREGLKEDNGENMIKYSDVNLGKYCKEINHFTCSLKYLI